MNRTTQFQFIESCVNNYTVLEYICEISNHILIFSMVFMCVIAYFTMGYVQYYCQHLPPQCDAWIFYSQREAPSSYHLKPLLIPVQPSGESKY